MDHAQTYANHHAGPDLVDDDPIIDAIETELRRLTSADSPCGSIVVTEVVEDGRIVAVADDWESETCVAVKLLAALRSLRDGAPIGTLFAEEGSVWAAIYSAVGLRRD